MKFYYAGILDFIVISMSFKVTLHQFCKFANYLNHHMTSKYVVFSLPVY